MKRFIMLFIVVALMLTACTNGAKEAETAAEVSKSGRSIQTEDNLSLTELDDESQTILKNSASILTNALTRCAYGLSSDADNPTEKIIVPYNADNAAQFLVMMMYYNDSDEYMKADKSIYSGSIYTDSDDVYHMRKSFISVVLKDTFGYIYSDEVEKILDEQLDFDYDDEAREYVISTEKLMEQDLNIKTIDKNENSFSDSDFSSDDNWVCKRIPNVKIDTLKKEIRVEYVVENNSSFDDDSEEEITRYNCENVYNYHVRDNNEYYLTIKSMNIIDYFKSINPDAI